MGTRHHPHPPANRARMAAVCATSHEHVAAPTASGCWLRRAPIRLGVTAVGDCPNSPSRGALTSGPGSQELQERGLLMAGDQRYDVIIIGTGAGGGTLAHRLAPSGKR